MWTEIQAQVYRYLAAAVALAPPLAASRFHEDLGMDETDFFGLVIRLENFYHLRLPDAELHEVTTVQQLIDCLERRFLAEHRYVGLRPGGSVFSVN